MIYIASDHGGFEVKEYIKKFLTKLNMQYVDKGPEVFTDGDDYPLYANLLVTSITPEDKGILICDTGIGMSIAANRHPGIRAALCTSIFEAMRAREHNDANILVLGSQTSELPDIEAMIKVFFDTEFSDEERHIRRIHELG